MSVIAELLTGLGAFISACAVFYARKAHGQACEANDAVNHTHKTGTPRLYDMVLDIHSDVKGIEHRVSKLEERGSTR